MPTDGIDDVLWFGAILFGGVSFTALAVASYARRGFRACLHAPLTHALGDSSEMWKEMATFCHIGGACDGGSIDPLHRSGAHGVDRRAGASRPLSKPSRSTSLAQRPCC
jgi:hypothetical protein